MEAGNWVGGQVFCYVKVCWLIGCGVARCVVAFLSGSETGETIDECTH